MTKQINLTLLFFSLLSPSIYSQSIQNDSSKIVKLFKVALQQPSKSDSINTEALNLVNSKAENSNLLKDIYYYNYSKYLFQTAQLDSSLIIAELGLAMYSHAPLHYKSSKFHNIIGSVLMFKNENESAIAQFQTSIKILELNKDYYQAALVKNNIANLFFGLTDYESSYKYSSQTYTTLKAENDTLYLPSTTGIFAISAIKLGRLNEGEALTNECLTLSEKYNNVVGLIVGNYSKGDLYLAKHHFEESSNYFTKSLNISESIGHPHYIIMNKIGLLSANLELKNYSLALDYGLQALAESKKMKNENTLYSIHKNLGYAYFGLNEFKNAYTNLNIAHDIYRSIATLENKKAINDILVKYDTEKKEKEIIQNELKIAQDEIKLNKRMLWILGLAGAILFLIISYYLYYRNQKDKFEILKKEDEQNKILALIKGEEKERERISNELHDGVASSLTGIKIKLEHINSTNPNTDVDNLVSQLTKLHEETRRISHNLMPLDLNQIGFLTAIKNYCKENTTQDLKINYVNLIDRKLKLDDGTAIVLYRIMQELINNVKKHANSPICFLQTSVTDTNFTISIEDEGAGFYPLKTEHSQGLTSIHKRITNLKGEMIIDSKINNGTLVIINIPI